MPNHNIINKNKRHSLAGATPKESKAVLYSPPCKLFSPLKTEFHTEKRNAQTERKKNRQKKQVRGKPANQNYFKQGKKAENMPSILGKAQRERGGRRGREEELWRWIEGASGA